MSFAFSALQRRLVRLQPPKLCSRSAGYRTKSLGRDIDFLTLPPHEEWRSVFSPMVPAIRDRVCLANPESADKVARAFVQKPSIAAGAGKGKVIIEAFPGPGTLSRALLALDKSVVRKLIILEDWPQYVPFLEALAASDPRVVFLPRSGYEWQTYLQIEEQGLLDDVEIMPWEGGVHPNLHFITHIPHTILGEQLVAQLFRNIPDRSWLFKYGRVPMSFVLGEWIWERVTAETQKSSRCKVSVISEATAELANAVPPSKLLPYDDHFHPRIRHNLLEKRPESRRLGHPVVAANVVPHEKQAILPGLLDKWDYCLRRMFVRKSTPISKAISSLGPGAESLLKVLTDVSLPPSEQLDPRKAVKDLNIAEWALIVRAFDYWPFAPETLSLHEAFSKRDA